MPIFAGWLSGIFISFASFFGAFLTQKIGVAIAATAIFVALTIAFMVLISTGINLFLTLAEPPQWFLVGFSFFMPTNFVAGVSAIIAAYIAGAVYHYHMFTLRIWAFAT